MFFLRRPRIEPRTSSMGGKSATVERWHSLPPRLLLLSSHHKGTPSCGRPAPSVFQKSQEPERRPAGKARSSRGGSMDYLTVPATSSLTGSEKLGSKEEQAAGGFPGPSASEMSTLILPIPPSTDVSTVLAATSVMPPLNRSREENKFTRVFHSGRSTRQPNSGHRQKQAGIKPHRRKRRRHRTLKDWILLSWKTLRPQLVKLRKIIYTLSQSVFFDIFIFTVVGINTMFLVAQTFAVVEIRGEWFFYAMDPVFLCIYVTEAVLKLIALDIDYFRDWWNDIDFFIMIMTVLDFVLSLSMYRKSNQFSTVRTFRILKICKGIRAIRAIRYILTLQVMKNLREAASTFALSAKSIGAILLLMFTFLCMFSVVLQDMYHDKNPKHFGDIFKTIFTLFQFLTLDDWSVVYLTCRNAGAGHIIFFLVIYILVEYFLLLNLVIAVLVDNFQMGLLKRQEELQKQKKRFHLKESSEHVASAEANKLPPWTCPEKVTSREEDEVFFRDRVTEKYGSLEMTDGEWQLFYSYFRLMMAIETQQQQFHSQAATSDKIVDTFFETVEEEDAS